MGHQLELINVSKLFGDVRAVDNVSLGIQHGEFLTLLGPSDVAGSEWIRQDHHAEYDCRF
jgi:ABC-type sugar transport system ATPase subunit